MSLETHVIVALSLTLLILLFVMWKDRRERRKNEKRLIQGTLGTLQNGDKPTEKLGGTSTSESEECISR